MPAWSWRGPAVSSGALWPPEPSGAPSRVPSPRGLLQPHSLSPAFATHPVAPPGTPLTSDRLSSGPDGLTGAALVLTAPGSRHSLCVALPGASFQRQCPCRVLLTLGERGSGPVARGAPAHQAACGGEPRLGSQVLERPCLWGWFCPGPEADGSGVLQAARRMCRRF